jgi:hypothetical protein
VDEDEANGLRRQAPASLSRIHFGMSQVCVLGWSAVEDCERGGCVRGGLGRGVVGEGPGEMQCIHMCRTGV